MTTRRTPRLRDLTRLDRNMLVLASTLATTVSVLGLLSSFHALENQARAWGWAWPWSLPVGIDMAIPAFTLAGLLLIRFDMPVAWVPLVPRLLTLGTVYLNWNAARTLPGRVADAGLVLLWVVFSEIAGHVYATLAGLESGTRMETIRRIRWVLAPLSTARMWRRQRLWEITSHREVMELERRRLLLRADLRDRHGRMWRQRMSRRDLTLMRLGDLQPVVSAPIPSPRPAVSVPSPSARRAVSARRPSPSRVVSTETETPVSAVSTETETAVSAPVSVSVSAAETPVSVSVSATETPDEDTRLYDAETETPQVSAETETETRRVSVVPITNKRAAIDHMKAHLLSVSNPRAVSVRDAMDVLGVPRSTAGKRLADAKTELGISTETETETAGTDDGDARETVSSS